VGIAPLMKLAHAESFPLLPTQTAVTALFSYCRNSPCLRLTVYDRGSQLC